MFIIDEISQNSEFIRQYADSNEKRTRGLIFERTLLTNVNEHDTVRMTHEKEHMSTEMAARGPKTLVVTSVFELKKLEQPKLSVTDIALA